VIEKHGRGMDLRIWFLLLLLVLFYFSALTGCSGDPPSVQDSMSKEVELLQKGRTWESVELPKGKKAEGCKMGLQEDRVSRESFVANGTGREAWCFVTKSNAKVQEMLGLEWHLWIVIALRGFGTNLRRKFVLLDLMGFKSR
jgi:hypothetical protein